MTDTPAHDWLLPRLDQLLMEAEKAGIERSISIAVLTDIITSSNFNPGHFASDVDA